MATGYEINFDGVMWTVRVDDLQIQATGITRDKDRIRANLGVYRETPNGIRIIWRDNANLSGGTGRQRFVNMAREKGVGVPERVLLALDAAIRLSPIPAVNGRSHLPVSTPAPTDFSGKVQTIAELHSTVSEWLLLEDTDLLVVTLGAVKAHRLRSE